MANICEVYIQNPITPEVLTAVLESYGQDELIVIKAEN